MMTLVVVYLYTVLAFNFFRKFYIQEGEEGGEPDRKCHNMLTVCWTFQSIVKPIKLLKFAFIIQKKLEYLCAQCSPHCVYPFPVHFLCLGWWPSTSWPKWRWTVSIWGSVLRPGLIFLGHLKIFKTDDFSPDSLFRLEPSQHCTTLSWFPFVRQAVIALYHPSLAA